MKNKVYKCAICIYILLEICSILNSSVRIESQLLNNPFNIIQLMEELDKLDRKLLNKLQKNDKISYKELSDCLNLAPSTVHNRVQNLINKGLIKRFSAVVSPQKLGYSSVAILGLCIDTEKMDEITHKLAQYKNILTIASSTGDYDLILKILAKNEKSLWRFINKNIKPIEGVRSQMNVSSFIDIYKDTNIIEL